MPRSTPVPLRPRRPTRFSNARSDSIETRSRRSAVSRAISTTRGETAPRSRSVRSTVVTGMRSTTVRSAGSNARLSWSTSEWWRARRHRGHVISVRSCLPPGSSQSAAADRCEAAARTPPAQHAASSSPFQVTGDPAIRYTPSNRISHRPVCNRHRRCSSLTFRASIWSRRTRPCCTAACAARSRSNDECIRALHQRGTTAWPPPPFWRRSPGLYPGVRRQNDRGEASRSSAVGFTSLLHGWASVWACPDGPRPCPRRRRWPMSCAGCRWGCIPTSSTSSTAWTPRSPGRSTCRSPPRRRWTSRRPPTSTRRGRSSRSSSRSPGGWSRCARAPAWWRSASSGSGTTTSPPASRRCAPPTSCTASTSRSGSTRPAASRSSSTPSPRTRRCSCTSTASATRSCAATRTSGAR